MISTGTGARKPLVCNSCGYSGGVRDFPPKGDKLICPECESADNNHNGAVIALDNAAREYRVRSEALKSRRA